MTKFLSKCNFCQQPINGEIKLVHHMKQGGVSLACIPCVQDSTKEIHKVPDREAYYVNN